MMIATFRSNPDAFGGNINWLYVDRTLALPAAAEAHAIPAAEADAEVIRQNAAWKNAVDRFVSADGNRRQQLNTILSGQQTDDPEIQALRDELRHLLTGLREERKALEEERKVRQANLFGTWGFGIALRYALTNRWEESRPPAADTEVFTYFDDQFSLESTPVAFGVTARNRLGGALEGVDLELGLHLDEELSIAEIEVLLGTPLSGRLQGWDLVGGLEYAVYRASSHSFREFMQLVNDTDIFHETIEEWASVEVSLLRLPVLLEKTIPLDSIPLLALQGGVVINRALTSERTGRRIRRDAETGDVIFDRDMLFSPSSRVAGGVSYDLRLSATARWRPEWTGQREVALRLVLEQSIGDPFGSRVHPLDHHRFANRQFLLEATADF